MEYSLTAVQPAKATSSALSTPQTENSGCLNSAGDKPFEETYEWQCLKPRCILGALGVGMSKQSRQKAQSAPIAPSNQSEQAPEVNLPVDLSYCSLRLLVNLR